VDGKKPMRLEDLPHFDIQSVDNQGTTLSGILNTSEGVASGNAYLLLSEELAIPGDLISFDENQHTALFRMSERATTDLVGRNLPLLDAYWSPNLIWQVLRFSDDAELSEEFQRTRIEECEICLVTIDRNQRAYKAGERFFCVTCFKRFVEQRDLSFVMK
jgi:hypothetical protein